MLGPNESTKHNCQVGDNCENTSQGTTCICKLGYDDNGWGCQPTATWTMFVDHLQQNPHKKPRAGSQQAMLFDRYGRVLFVLLWILPTMGVCRSKKKLSIMCDGKWKQEMKMGSAFRFCRTLRTKHVHANPFTNYLHVE